MLNHISIMGRMVSDPELKNFNESKLYCPFRIACDRDYKNKGSSKYETDYINCVIWGTGAKVIASNFKKGNRICVEGRLQSRKYEKDGKKKEIVEIIISNFYFVDVKADAASTQKTPRLEPDPTPEPQPEPESYDDYEEIMEEIDVEPNT